MKSFICIIFLFIIFTTRGKGNVVRDEWNDTRNSGKCTIKTNIILFPGESVKDPNEDCRLIVCNEQGNVEYQNCGPLKVHGCKEYLDKSLPFPDCCARHSIC